MKTVKVKLFGAFRKYGNGREILIDIDEGLNVSDLRHRLLAAINSKNPGFSEEALVFESAFANEESVLADNDMVLPGQVLAILPPVCGG